MKSDQRIDVNDSWRDAGPHRSFDPRAAREQKLSLAQELQSELLAAGIPL
jgi:hypothetical protein